MTFGTWQQYNGHRWRMEKVPYGVNYDRRRTILVTIEGSSRIALVSNVTQAQESAHRIINNMGGTDESLRIDG